MNKDQKARFRDLVLAWLHFAKGGEGRRNEIADACLIEDTRVQDRLHELTRMDVDGVLQARLSGLGIVHYRIAKPPGEGGRVRYIPGNKGGHGGGVVLE